MQYLHLYYSAVLLALFPAPLYLVRKPAYDVRLLRGLAVTIVVTVDMIGMYCSDGIDLGLYRQNFEEGYEHRFPDVGFRRLIDLFNFLSAPLSGLTLIIGTVSLFTAYRLARFYRISFVLLLIVWFMHTAVVRDFSKCASDLRYPLQLLDCC